MTQELDSVLGVIFDKLCQHCEDLEQSSDLSDGVYKQQQEQLATLVSEILQEQQTAYTPVLNKLIAELREQHQIACKMDGQTSELQERVDKLCAEREKMRKQLFRQRQQLEKVTSASL
jgi:hypothetical protein